MGDVNSNMVAPGIIKKSHQNSWFVRFDCNSGYEKKYLYGPNDDVIILQVLVVSANRMIAECVYKKDYEIKEKSVDG